MNTKQITAHVVGALIADPRYTYANHDLIADVVRMTVEHIDGMLCGELEDAYLERDRDRAEQTVWPELPRLKPITTVLERREALDRR